MDLHPARRVAAVVFDLDGTLIDTAPDLHRHLHAVLAGLGRGPVDLASTRRFVGHGARELLRRALAATGAPADDDELNALTRQYIERYSLEPLRDGAAYDGVFAVLERFSADGLRLGVCTNKPQAPSDLLLRRIDMMRYFGSVIGGDALPVRKPDPEHLAAVLRELEVAPAAAVMVGDSVNDVRAARALGVPSVVVSFGYSEVPVRELGADLVLDDMAKLPAALARLAAA